jgi:PKD domain
MQNRPHFCKREGAPPASFRTAATKTTAFSWNPTSGHPESNLHSKIMNPTILTSANPTLVNRKSPILNLLAIIGLLFVTASAHALDRTNIVFKVFQFPADKIPTVDGQTNDWNIVPESYAIHLDQFVDDTGRHPQPDSANLSISIKVGWVKGLNRLYFLYEADDDYWDFSEPGLHNDTLELVVDGDLSGGPLIDRFLPAKDTIGQWETYFTLQGAHAQNYHIFTPAEGKDWCMAWGPAQWVKELPYANAATSYHFRPGESGHLVEEFWITPFDYAGAGGPPRAVESVLKENKIIGMSFAIIDYDDVHSADTNNGFWNLSRHHTMYGQADQLCAFKLMPLEPQFKKPIEAQWSFQVVDMDRRLVAFKDLSTGQINSWHWDFGDGETSTEQEPQHVYKKPDHYVVVLDIAGPAGKSRRSKVWDVAVK